MAAAIEAARSGLKTIILERNAEPGGRCATREFHPGYHASPFADEIAPIPRAIFQELGLLKRGVIFVPAPCSTALWPGKISIIQDRCSSGEGFAAHARTRVGAAMARAGDDLRPPPRWFTPEGSAATSWPCAPWAEASLSDCAADWFSGNDDRAHVVALALMGRSADASLTGSALHLAAPGSGGSGIVVGGLARLGSALAAIAREAGVTLRCGLDVADIRHERGRVHGVSLADGTEISAANVISTLDLKRTFLSLFTWSSLPEPVVRRVNTFRMAGSTARLLLALEKPPAIPAFDENPELARGPIVIAPDPRHQLQAHAAWRSGAIPARPPMVLRLISAVDPQAAPPGRATMTVTVGSIPAKLFDGAWTRERREILRGRIFEAIDSVLPGTSANAVAAHLFVPPDFEELLGLTEGDLWGGEIAADQMDGLRPWTRRRGSRTALKGLYLAGPSTASGVLGTCLSGVLAARTIKADRERRWLS
jgi:phytoene dehydrogenase-like protein